jgi:3-dehydroquinate dehydratase-1
MNPQNICVCLCGIGFQECLEAAQTYPLLELRLDMLQLTKEQIKRILQCKAKIIATCRSNGANDNTRMEQLCYAIENGAAMTDIEIEAPPDYRRRLTQCAQRNNCSIIISYHNYTHTPSAAALLTIAKSAQKMNADITKIAAMAHSAADAARLMGLYDACKDQQLVSIGMGKAGEITRIAAIPLGAPFTYAALLGHAAAPNQIDHQRLTQIFHLIQYF